MLKLGELIRQKRRELNMTQTELAKQVGVTVGYIGKIEIGKKPSLFILFRIGHILGIPPTEIIKEDTEMVNALMGLRDKLGDYDKEFSKLPTKVKIVLLELAPIIEKSL